MFKYALLLGLVGSMAAFFFGMRVESWRVEAQGVRTVTKIVRVVQHDASVATQVATTVQKTEDRVHYVTRTIHDQIPIAVPAAADPVLGNGWVRLHDAAALGVPPVAASPAEPDDAASGITAAQALSVVTDNYSDANTCLAQLKGWQDWARGVGLTK